MQDLHELIDVAGEEWDKGNTDKAIAIYEKILAQKEDWSVPHYNLGLIYKYQKEWSKSYHHNKRAVELNPEDGDPKWNLGIAATMLKDWKLARECWNFFGTTYEIIDEDPAGDIGPTPIRLNPDGNGEVVWTTRICPARAVINNIPYPESEHRYRDVVLNDGAANGHREFNGVEYAVLDEIQLLNKSPYQTFSVKCKLQDVKHYENLARRCSEADIATENWTTSVRMLCKQCSEGKPHKAHDHDLVAVTDENLIAFASTSQEKLKQVLDAWCDETGNDYYESHYY